jgi:hypothetical protein
VCNVGNLEFGGSLYFLPAKEDGKLAKGFGVSITSDTCYRAYVNTDVGGHYHVLIVPEKVLYSFLSVIGALYYLRCCCGHIHALSEDNVTAVEKISKVPLMPVIAKPLQ